MTTRVPVTAEQVESAVAHIQSCIDNHETAVDLTALGCLSHVAMSLGVVLDVQR